MSKKGGIHRKSKGCVDIVLYAMRTRNTRASEILRSLRGAGRRSGRGGTCGRAGRKAVGMAGEPGGSAGARGSSESDRRSRRRSSGVCAAERRLLFAQVEQNARSRQGYRLELGRVFPSLFLVRLPQTIRRSVPGWQPYGWRSTSWILPPIWG
jgi:hypothetical protein